MDSDGNMYGDEAARARLREMFREKAEEVRPIDQMPPHADGLSEEEAAVLLKVNRHYRRAVLSEMRRGRTLDEACTALGIPCP